MLFSWEVPQESVASALARSAGGYLSKALKAKEVVDALEAIRDGEVVVLTHTLDPRRGRRPVGGRLARASARVSRPVRPRCSP